MYAENFLLLQIIMTSAGSFPTAFPLVINGYRWLSTVSDGYRRLSTITLSGRVLQKISANDGNDNCKCADDLEYIWTIDNPL